MGNHLMRQVHTVQKYMHECNCLVLEADFQPAAKILQLLPSARKRAARVFDEEATHSHILYVFWLKHFVILVSMARGAFTLRSFPCLEATRVLGPFWNTWAH